MAKNWSEARMSPSKIGALANPNACLLCFWTLLRMKFRKPFSFPMPAIMYTLDAQQKELVDVHVSRGLALPKYFGDFNDVVEVISMPSVSGYHAETNLELYGRPDLMVRLRSGEIVVIDNKTAQPKDPDHPLFLQYTAQLNFYAWVAGMMDSDCAPTRLGLLNYAICKLEGDELLEATEDDFMLAKFSPVMQEIVCNPEDIVVPLLWKVRELIDATEAPDGAEGCPDCALLKEFRDCMVITDASCLRYMDVRERERHFASERCRAARTLDCVRQAELDSLPGFAAIERPESVLANWDCV